VVEQDPDMNGPERRGALRDRQAWLPAALALLVASAPVQPAPAEERSDFTFRRLKPPEPGGGPRITVQIDPEEQKRLLAASPAVPPRPATPLPAAPATDAAPGEAPFSRYAWFWDAVPPALGAVDGRFARALAALSAGPGGERVAAPRMQEMAEIAARHGTEILLATVGTAVSPALALAVIAVESAGRPDAVSRAGAQGLMQLIPATAARFGVTDAMDPTQNIKGGVAYLDWLMRAFDRDPIMVIAAYNAGERAVRESGGVPPFAETRDYVPKVLAAWQVAQGLCLTPPELMTDPCVFRPMRTAALP
jgi:soluble lytic murein transglycosylase-like protein